jgi:phospholipase/lecithinase/hemolysin
MAVSYLASIPAVTPIASSALFVVWGGPDDFLSPSPLDANGIAVANRAVTNLVDIVEKLQGLGAQTILVPGLPDLGLTPFQLIKGPIVAGEASALSDYFNAQLLARLPAGVIFFDTAALLRTVVENPGAFGFTNVTDPCFDAEAGTVCSNPGQYLFWDDIHPSARSHEILAAQFVAAVPEPSTLGLVGSVFGLWLIRSRQRKNRHV